MLGINLGQVMKEMPNFAISARIGIMSLTNNLPMLGESIKMVRVEQQAMAAAGKQAPSMIKLFASSIFGLTGVMSIAMVLLQLYSKEIIAFISNTSKAEQAQNEFNKKLKEGNNFYTDAKKEIIEVEANLRLAEKGTIDGAKALENYNTKLSGTFGAATDVVSALKNIQDNKTAYITALVQMTAAQDLLTLAVNKSSEALGLEQKGKPGFFSYVGTVGKTILDTFDMNKWGDITQFPKMLDKIARTGEITYQNYFNKIDKLRQESADGVTSYTQEIDKIANKYKDDPFIASLLGLDTGDKGKNENLKKASENRALMLAQFDYETKRMEAQAKSLERGRERDIQLAEADYTKKLNQSAISQKKLKEQEKKGVKGATAALSDRYRHRIASYQ